MPLLTLLAGILVRLAGSLLGRVLGWLGFTAVTFIGTDSLINLVVNNIGALATGLPAVAFKIMGLLKLDLALSMILSAYAFRISQRFGIGGAVRRLMSGIGRR